MGLQMKHRIQDYLVTANPESKKKGPVKGVAQARVPRYCRLNGLQGQPCCLYLGRNNHA